MTRPDTRPQAITLADARSLRAYAHPLRMELLGLLREKGTLTATQAAAILGESSGSCSFHLRQMAKYGLVEPVPRQGVERPWRASAHATRWTEEAKDPQTAAAARQFTEVLVDHYLEQVHGWLNRRPREPRAWREAAWLGDRLIAITPSELKSLNRQVDELFKPYRQRITNPRQAKPTGARAVTSVTLTFPRPSDRRK